MIAYDRVYDMRDVCVRVFCALLLCAYWGTTGARWQAHAPAVVASGLTEASHGSGERSLGGSSEKACDDALVRRSGEDDPFARLLSLRATRAPIDATVAWWVAWLSPWRVSLPCSGGKDAPPCCLGRIARSIQLLC